jgi:hypothetical protein
MERLDRGTARFDANQANDKIPAEQIYINDRRQIN